MCDRQLLFINITLKRFADRFVWSKKKIPNNQQYSNSDSMLLFSSWWRFEKGETQRNIWECRLQSGIFLIKKKNGIIEATNNQPDKLSDIPKMLAQSLTQSFDWIMTRNEHTTHTHTKSRLGMHFKGQTFYDNILNN